MLSFKDWIKEYTYRKKFSISLTTETHMAAAWNAARAVESGRCADELEKHSGLSRYGILELADKIRRGGIAFVVMVVLALAAPAQAGVILEGGVGASIFFPTVDDGVWYQEAFPHHFDTVSVAGRIGAGWRFNERWSVALSALRLGSVKSTSEYVADRDYNSVTHRCLDHCDQPGQVRAVDTMQGVEASAKYVLVQSPLANTVLPFVRLGWAMVYHDLHAAAHTFVGDDQSQHFHGWIPMISAGGGICYRRWTEGAVCAEVSYYYGNGTRGYPISTSVIVPMLTLEIAF